MPRDDVGRGLSLQQLLIIYFKNSAYRKMQDSGYIIEFTHAGRMVKVTAVCPRTYCEAAIVGDPRMGEQYLTNLAIKKLKYVMSRDSKNNG